MSVLEDRGIGLSNNFLLFFFSAEPYYPFAAEIDLCVFYLEIGSLDKTEIINFGIDAKG